MLDIVVGVLSWAGQFTQPLGWLVVVLFVVGVALERIDRSYARPVFVVAWIGFALFWFTLIHYFGIQEKSVIEGVGSLIAVPLSGYVAYLLWNGRDSLFVLSRAIAAMGLLYVPFVTIPALREVLIETVTAQTAFVMQTLGFETNVVDGLLVDGYRITGKIHPYESTFVFYHAGEIPLTYTIRIVCTGIGSMAIVAGLVLAVRAPADRKLRALALSIPIIYVLNIVRNVFISASLGEQALQVFPGLIMSLFALESPRMVSYIVADRIISQSLSVVALVVIVWLVIRELPEVLIVVEDVIYLFTGREYDLQSALGVERAERP
jgi:archaeosortase A (PGF-CTERM-specific)